MTTPGSLDGAVASFCRLLEVSNRAARIYEIAIPTIRKSALRNLVTVLLQQHVLHVKRLRNHLSSYSYERESGSSMGAGEVRVESVWNQIDGALASGNPVLVLNGCRCVERTVTGEFRMALRGEALTQEERQLLTVQVGELLCAQESIDTFQVSPFARFARRTATELKIGH
jgi:hypothetical protein